MSDESIVVWPAERRVRATDFQPITLWQSEGRVLPVASLQNRDTLFTHSPAAISPVLDQKKPIDHTTISFPTQAQAPQRTSPLERTQTKNRFLRLFLLGIMIISFVIMAIVVVPELYYRLNPESANEVATHQNVPAPEIIEPVATPEPLPPIDPSLPLGEWVRVPKIGVDAGVLATLNPDEALEKGAWMVPDFGRPDDFTQPTIIASHRYGWLWWWQSDFGRKNSFYYLPDTQPGDTIEVVADQRRYIYEIYAVEEGDAITDYEADLILYTCKFMNSPERYFVYANRVPVDELQSSRETPAGDTVVFDKR